MVFLAVSVAVVLVLYLLSLNLPVFGDAYAYGYRSARWMSENGLAFVPQGTERGAQAMGHPSFFFWLWAVFMSVFGDTMAVTRLLPALGTLMALTGTYLLARDLARSRWAGFLSAAALLVSPLFITQSFRPIPDSAMVACMAWSLYFYRSKRFTPAALVCFAGVMFREQAIFLAGAYFLTEILRTGLRKPLRLALFASPVLVIVITGLLNLAANGYFFFPTYMGENTASLPSGWLITRFRLFAGHLLAEDFRWVPVVAALAALTAKGRKAPLPLPSILLLLTPALFYPPGRILYLLVVAGALTWHLYREGAFPSRMVAVMILFPAFLVLFHVLIVFFAMDPALDLFRYVIGAYPVIIAGSIALLWKHLGSGTASVIGCIFIAATASSNTSARHFLQPETSLACLRPLMDLEEVYSFAADNADSVIVPDLALEMARNSALGYNVDTDVFRGHGEDGPPLAEWVVYAVVVSTWDMSMSVLERVEEMVPRGSVLDREPLRTWSYGPWKTYCHIIRPEGGE